jgi:RNA polymerase sigma factor (sigma-70 family)
VAGARTTLAPPRPGCSASPAISLRRITALDRDALRAEIGEALEALSPERRNAVRLRIVDGLGYDAVAARLGCSEQTARAHVSRGLRRLASALDHATSRSTEMTTG